MLKDMTLAVAEALNPNTPNQTKPNQGCLRMLVQFWSNISYFLLFGEVFV